MDDLNHPKIKPFTREIASSLSLDPLFVEFVFADSRPGCFRYWVEDVNSGWTCYVPGDCDIAYPLWCTNADQTLIVIKGESFYFAKGWHDNPDLEMISQTTHGLLTHLMAELADGGESDDELERAAGFCGFRFLDDLLRLMDDAPDASWAEALEGFIADVDAASR